MFGVGLVFSVVVLAPVEKQWSGLYETYICVEIGVFVVSSMFLVSTAQETNLNLELG